MTFLGRFTIWMSMMFHLPALAQTSEEYRLKAAFLYNLAKFVEWPPQAFAGPNEPVTICVLGQNPFGTALGDAVRGKTAQDHPLTVKTISKIESNCSCNVVFVTRYDRKRSGSILDSIADRPI